MTKKAYLVFYSPHAIIDLSALPCWNSNESEVKIIMSTKLNSNSAIIAAKELTLKAIENNLIIPNEDPKETAKDIAEFMHTLMDALENGE